MKALVVFDSVYGNTEKIAKAIGKGLSASYEVTVLSAVEVKPKNINKYDLLVVGAPTQAGRATSPVRDFLKDIPKDGLKNIRATTFDTRIPTEGKGAGTRFVVKIFGYAAGRIAETLKKKGAEIVFEPDGFAVADTQGPLMDGELERAEAWGKSIPAKYPANKT